MTLPLAIWYVVLAVIAGFAVLMLAYPWGKQSYKGRHRAPGKPRRGGKNDDDERGT